MKLPWLRPNRNMGDVTRRLERRSSAGARNGWQWIVCGALCLGCDFADGLTDVGGSLADPDAALLDHPGRKVAAGAFHELVIDGSLEAGGHVLALEQLDEGKRLAIIPYLEEDPCFVEPAHAFGRLSSRIDVELPGLVAVQRDADSEFRGKGRLSFVDFDCNEVLPSIDNASVPRITFPAGDSKGMLSLSGDGKLYLIEPAARSVNRIASNVAVARSSGDMLWTIEDDKLVIRDSETKIVAEMGKNVSAFYITGGTEVPVAFLDDEGLWVWFESGETELITKDVCFDETAGEPFPQITSLGPDSVTYFEDCQERRPITVLTVGDDEDEARLVSLIGPRHVTSPTSIIVSWVVGLPDEMLFFRGEAGSTFGELRAAKLDVRELLEAQEPMKLETKTVITDVWLRAGQLYRNYNGSSGELLQLERDDEQEIIGVRSVAEGVAQLPGGSAFSSRGILIDYEAPTGTLALLDEDDEGEISSTELVSGVPIQNQVVEAETGRIAFIGKSEDGRAGTLFLTREGKPSQLQEISDDVLLETARFLEEPRGLSFLHRSKEGYPSMRVWLIDSELELTVHKSVSEYRVVPWPAPGVLYAVPEGEDQGLWYAKAR